MFCLKTLLCHHIFLKRIKIQYYKTLKFDEKSLKTIKTELVLNCKTNCILHALFDF